MKRVKNPIILLSIIAISTCLSAQSITTLSTHHFKNTFVTFLVTSYSTSEKADQSIEFAVIGDLQNKKPLLFVVEGSGHNSSFAIDSLGAISYIFPNELFTFLDRFNILIMGKFGVPILYQKELPNASFNYTDPTGNVPAAYILNTNLITSKTVFTQVITKILKKSANKHFLSMGHSQGARIALELLSHPKTMGAIYMSCDPLGRFASAMDTEYASFEKRNEERYDFYASIVKDGSNLADSVFRGDTYYAWQSFSYPSLLSMGKTNKPIFVSYGDMDKSCPNCYIFDLLPIYLKNITVYKYKGLDHNYFDTNQIRHFDKVYSDALEWVKNL